MENQLNFYVQETPSGEIILNDPDGGLDGNASGHVKVFKTRKELADYINPQVAEPAAPPYPSNQAQASAMNINAANAMCGGQQFHMANLAAQQYSVPFAASLPKQYDCNNCKGIKNADGSCGCKSNAEKIKNDMEQQLLAKAETARADGFLGDNKNVFVIKEQSAGSYKFFHHRGNRDPYTAQIFALDKSAAQLVCSDTVDQDLFRRQRQAKGHVEQKFAVTSPARVHNDSIVCIIQLLQIDTVLLKCNGGAVPLINVQCHRA